MGVSLVDAFRSLCRAVGRSLARLGGTDGTDASASERRALVEDLGRLEDAMARSEASLARDMALVHADHRADAVNLSHYLALRHEDERSLQRRLGRRGLSSLGRCEPHVRATVESVRAALGCAPGVPVPPALSFEGGRAALDHNTDVLFGPRPPGRVTRIMVTLPSEAAWDYELVRHLVTSGMDLARINGAHDGPDEWEAMAHNVHKASGETGRPCRISMDLPGPKLRTGPLLPGPRVVKLRPTRDQRGVAVTPARVSLVAGGSVSADARRVTGAAGGGADEGLTAVPLPSAWIDRRRPGDVVDLADTRGSRRELQVVACAPGGCTAEAWDTTYVETGTELDCAGDRAVVGELPPLAQHHLLESGDHLWLTESLRPAEPWAPGGEGTARLGCTLPSTVFEVVVPGQHVVLDDGKLAGVIERVEPGALLVRIEWAPTGGAKLRAEKGVNLPDIELPLPAVSDADLPLLRVAARQADMVALSFLRNERDVDAMRAALARVGAEDIGLVLKIETGPGFVRLPEILLHAMRTQRVGVMIARGDLATEAGYERLAEMQEEILWLSEAARLPVIWATEVLDRLARTGQPSRAEVTDAAMAQRAECVMLNKGPHVDDAIVVLDDILRRMSGHQRKKASLLRPLHSWVDATGA